MSLASFMNDLIDVHNGGNRDDIFIVVDNAEVGIIPRSSRYSHAREIPERAYRRSSDTRLLIDSEGYNRKVHPAMAIEKVRSDTALAMPQREDSLNSIFDTPKSQKGEKRLDRWSLLIGKKNSSRLSRKPHMKLHDKLFGDTKLSLPSRVLSPKQRENKNRASPHKKKPSESSRVGLNKNKLKLITNSALAIVTEGFPHVKL